MQRIYASFLLMLLVPAISFGQRYTFPQYQYNNMQYDNSVLSIFSENGEPFYLVLNGMRQNLMPQTKIRVESLPKYQNDVQITFADPRIPPIRRTINIADPINSKAVNLTLRLSRGRSGEMRLKFHRMTECDRTYRGPRDEYVMYYGKPQQINTETTTTYMDPITGQWITETTTTTTDQTYYDNNRDTRRYDDNRRNDDRRYDNRNNNYNTPPPASPAEMDMRTFNDAKQSINNASFEDTKLSTAKTVLNNNFATTNQIMDICGLFSFENTKVTFAKFAYSRCVDPQNYYRVANVFSFDSDKKVLNDFINRGGR